MEKRGNGLRKIDLKKDKRGIQLTLEIILILILTVSAVVILAAFFATSSTNFFGKLKGYFTHSNVDSVTEGCNILSGSGSTYAFCCEKKDVKYSLDGEKTSKEFTCNDLVNEKFINDKINSLDCDGINC